MRNINLRYVKETYDENGLLKHLDIDCPDDFNFGYDIVDDIAVIRLTERDVVRHPLVMAIVRAYERDEQKREDVRKRKGEKR